MPTSSKRFGWRDRSSLPPSLERQFLWDDIGKIATKALTLEGEAREMIERLIIIINEALGETREETMAWLRSEYELTPLESAPAAPNGGERG